VLRVPHVVAGQTEDETILVHPLGLDSEHNDLPVASTNSGCGLLIWREMNRVSSHLSQATFADAGEVVLRGAVEEDLRRLLRLVPKVHCHRVALSSSDTQTVFADLEPLLVVVRDQAIKSCSVGGQPGSCVMNTDKQLSYGHPTGGIQGKTRLGRLVSQDEGKELGQVPRSAHHSLRFHGGDERVRVASGMVENLRALGLSDLMGVDPHYSSTLLVDLLREQAGIDE
jgi:hypothetical protein